jgi:hypothetical protein
MKMNYKLTKKDRNKLLLLPLIIIVFGIYCMYFIPNSDAASFTCIFTGIFTTLAIFSLWFEQNKKPTIKVGLDLHGVISANPKFFSHMSKALILTGAEVHIITGSHSIEILGELKKYDVKYTHLFSIADHHRSIGTKMWYDENKTPWIDKGMWEMTKAEYCEKEGIDFHFDDSDIYGEYFKTPYAKISVKGYNHRVRHKETAK